MLLHSNIIIYSALPGENLLVSFLSEHKPYCSRISYLEALGYHRLQPYEKKYLDGFFKKIQVIELGLKIILEATKLRQKINIASCDAIIAATAILYGLNLVTNNEKDFKNIKGLKIINPLHQ